MVVNMVLRVITLNCWALPRFWPLIGSKDRKFRIMKLIEAFLNEEYDIIALQEIWCEKDYDLISTSIKNSYPYSYYFHSGFTGSGVCIFSRYTIISALMHRYSLNGFAHHIHRGDWFGGKVVGMVEISFHDCRINFYNTHLHAEYNRMNDLYLPHRLSQAVELSQFIKYTSKGADLVILTGDLNIEPTDLGYRVITVNAGLIDAWLMKPNFTDERIGMTCDRPDNCYTHSSANSHGKRIDYILYRGVRRNLNVVVCENRLGHIPDDSGLDYSDHIGVYAEFNIFEEMKENIDTVMPSEILKEAIRITSEGEERAIWDRRLFLSACVLLILVLLATVNVDIFFPTFSAVATLFRFLITFVIAFCLWYGFIGLTMELKALKAAKSILMLLLKE